jgi:uncharacterized membrane protein (DUF106 family)
MYVVVKVLLSVIAALTLALATSTYLQHRQAQEQKARAEQFQREMQRAGSKNWGNSAKTIQNW